MLKENAEVEIGLWGAKPSHDRQKGMYNSLISRVLGNLFNLILLIDLKQTI